MCTLFEIQEILLDLVSRTYAKPMKWDNAREAGLFLWIRSTEMLVSGQTEILLIRNLEVSNGDFGP